jgi:DNA-directed RNA polymerase I subunit RPA49
MYRYLVGVRSKSAKTVTIRDAPFHIVRRDVKRLKLLAPIASTQTAERVTQRSKLGEAFGTKKAIKAIKARERNQVDVSKMESILGIIGEGVETRTGGLPTEGSFHAQICTIYQQLVTSIEQAKEIVDSSRPIPHHDPSALNLEDVYPLSMLIPDPELNGIRVSNIISADGDSARLRLLPFSRSTYINLRIQDMRLDSGQTVTASLRRRL